MVSLQCTFAGSSALVMHRENKNLKSYCEILKRKWLIVTEILPIAEEIRREIHTKTWKELVWEDLKKFKLGREM